MKGKEAIERLQELTSSCTQELFKGFGCQLRPAESDASSEMGPCTRAAVSGSHVNGTILIAASPALLKATAAGDEVTPELELDWLCEISNLMLARIRTLAMQQGIEIDFATPVLGPKKPLGGTPRSEYERLVAFDRLRDRLAVWLQLRPVRSHENAKVAKAPAALLACMQDGPMTFSEWEGSGADATRRVAVVVDDSRIMRRKIGVVLEQQGFEVIEADNGMNGLRALNPEDPPTVVFTDLRMRVMDGVEFITRIRAIEQYAKVPILMVTGECSPQLIKRGSAAGANGMLVKPFTDDTLHKVVMGILTRQADNSAA